MRWLVRLVLGTIAFVLIALIVIAIVLETSWGREQIRSHAEAALADSFPGSRVESIDGSVFGTLVLHGISIAGADGKPVVTVGTVEVEVNMFALLIKHVRVKRLAVDDVVIVPHAPATKESKEDGGGGSWSLALENVEVRHAQIVMPAGRVELSGLDVDATLDAPAGHALVALVRASGNWRDQPATAIALATFDKGAVEVPFAIGVAGGDEPARAIALDVRMSEAGVLDGAVVARVPVVAARALGAIELPAELAALVTTHASQIDLRAEAGAASVRALMTADVTARSARGLVIAEAPDLAPLTQGKVTGGATAVAALEADPDHLRGLVSVKGDRDGHHAVALVAVDATRDGAWTLTEANTDIGVAHASVIAKLIRHGDAIELASAKLQGHAAELATEKVSADDLDVLFTAKGPLWPKLELHGEGSIDGTDLAVSGTALDEAHVRLARGKVGSDGAIDVDIASHSVVMTGGATWSGEGGHVALHGKTLALADLHTSNGTGQVVAGGRYQLDTGDLAGDVTAHDVAVAAFAPGHAGVAAGHAKVARKAGGWDASAQLTATGLVVATDHPPCDASATVELHGRRLALHASTSAAAVGLVSFDSELDAPRDVTDVAAWRRLDRRALRSAKLAATKVELAGADPALSGALDGELDVSGTTSGGALHLTGVHTSRGDVDVDLALAPPEHADLAPRLTASMAGIAQATATIELALPAHPFDPAAWRKLGRGAIAGGKLDSGNITLEPQMLERLGVHTPYRGTVALSGELAPRATSASITLAVHGFQGGALVQPIDLDVTATTDQQGTRATGTVETGGKPLLALDAGLPITIDQLRTADPTTAPLAGRLGLPALADPGAPPPTIEAHKLLAMFGREDVEAGTLSGTVTLAGTPRAPTVKANLTAHDIALKASVEGRAPALLHDLTLVASWDRVNASFDLTAHEPTGGLLHVNAHGEPAHAATLVAKLDAATFDIAPVTAFAPGALGASRGVLDASLTLDGFDPDHGKLTGGLHVHDARVPLHDLIGTLRQADLDVRSDGSLIKVKVGGKLGRGSVDGTAKVTLVGSTPSKADITLALTQISLIRAHQPVIDAEVTAKLTNGKKWTGDVTISKAHVVVPSSGGTTLLEAATPGDLVFVDAPPKNPTSLLQRPPPSHPWLVTNVTLDTTRVDVQDDEYKVAAWIGGKLSVSVGGESIGMDGTIDTQRADLELFGDRNAQLDHARVVFDGTIDPVLDVRVIRDLDTLVVTADVGGRASKPEVTFSSDSGSYSQGDLAAFFVGGQPDGDRGEVGQAAAAAAAGYASALFTKKLNKLLPIHLDLELRYEAATATTSDAFDVARQLGADTHLEYRHLLDPRPDENVDEGIIEHHLGESWLVRTSIGRSALEWNGGGEIQHRWHW
jgi:hypothetical protein